MDARFHAPIRDPTDEEIEEMRVTLMCEVMANNGAWVCQSRMFDSEQLRTSNIDLLNYTLDQIGKIVNEQVDTLNAELRELEK